MKKTTYEEEASPSHAREAADATSPSRLRRQTTHGTLLLFKNVVGKTALWALNKQQRAGLNSLKSDVIIANGPLLIIRWMLLLRNHLMEVRLVMGHPANTFRCQTVRVVAHVWAISR
ncbi:hypothetical protein O6H91_04G089000 [Diphasiastrum complanatum]|uniref:Uncharacterized protein n=1 Tax=Diphasiastrum complanatum TaxID=34168 RepID=A0ACC2DZ36_DIPCM|nr:hypothetical protein O6H91_04G089000 [Diphasiastrum complanatum]